VIMSPFVLAFRQICSTEPGLVVPDLLCNLSKQQLAVLRGKGHSGAADRLSEHPSPLSGSLN